MNRYHMVLILNMHVKRFTCQHGNHASLMVYPGMLTLYQIIWTDIPLTTLWCNIIQTKSIDLSFHMYTTLVVNMPSIDIPNLIVTITSNEIHQYNFHRVSVRPGSDMTEQSLLLTGRHGDSHMLVAHLVMEQEVDMEFNHFRAMATTPNIHKGHLNRLFGTATPEGKMLSAILFLVQEALKVSGKPNLLFSENLSLESAISLSFNDEDGRHIRAGSDS